MGLRPGTPVGAALIDAHAGGIGTVGADPDAGPEQTMAYVFGTSACTMASSTKPHKVPGIWGPYYSAMVPGLWLSEGGQSAAGEAIAHLIRTHPAREAAEALASGAGLSLQDYLSGEVVRRAPDISDAVHLAGRRLIVPDFLGNRAPFANPEATGVIAGLTLRSDVDDLIATYVAAITGIGYGLRQILEAQAEQGIRPEAIAISGGAGRTATVKQLLADASGLPVLSTTTSEPVLLGAAMLGAVGARHFATLKDAMEEMSSIAERFSPAGAPPSGLHQARFEAFENLQAAEHYLGKALLG